MSPTSRLSIPAEVGDLSTEWLTQALGAEVVAFQVERSIRHGLFGDMSRLRLTYRDRTVALPESVVVKLSSRNPEMRARPNTRMAYFREVHFYRDLAREISLPTPACFHADVEVEEGLHVLLLEDLAPAETLSAREGCPVDKAELAIEAVARFHGRWWEAPSLYRIDWMIEPGQIDERSVVRDHDEWWPKFAEEASDRVDPSVLALGERLGRHRPFLMRRLFASAPRTLIHRDYSTGNMMFSTASGGRPFTVIDWQSVTRGRGVWDVAWFMGQSLTIEQRRAMQDRLLVLYHESLCDSGVTGYGFEECREDFRCALLQRFGSLISTIAAMPMNATQRQLVIEVLLPRNLAALEDNDAASVLDGSDR